MSEILAAPTTSTSPSFRELCRPGVEALRKHWRPFLLIQTAALGALIAFFCSPAVRDLCGQLAEFKDRGGWVSAAIASALAGGLLPELAKLATGLDPKPPRKRVRDIIFTMVFFALNGTAVYLLYKVQSHLFGDDGRFVTTIKKVVFDELGFTVFFSMPTSLAAFTWLKHDLKLKPTLADLAPRPLLARLPTLIIPCWAFWVPMTMMIYSLPPSIQFVLFSLALGAWSLLLLFITTEEM